MPINFQPASPFAPNINANFGAADQYNRIYPQLADLYASAGRNITQASAQTAQNFTQGNIASAENQTRRTLQGFQIDAEEMQQRRQIEAQREAQQRQQQFELQRMMIPISRQEQMEQTRRIDGLAEIERQLADRTLTPEQAGDARYELMTGINRFQQRQQMQQADLRKAQEAQINQEMANITKAQAAQEDFYLKLAKNGVTIQDVLDSSTGKTRPLAYDPKTGKLYNPFLEHMGKQSEVPEYDWAKALKDAKAEAEAAYPVQKDKDEEIRVSKERNDYIQRIMERDRYKSAPPPSAVPGLSPQQAPIDPRAVQQAVQAPSQPQPVQQAPPVSQLVSRLTAIKSQYPDLSKAPLAVQEEARRILEAGRAAR